MFKRILIVLFLLIMIVPVTVFPDFNSGVSKTEKETLGKIVLKKGESKMSDNKSLLNCADSIKKALMSNNTTALKNLYMKNYRGISIRGEFETLDLILEFYKPGAVKLEKFEYTKREVEVIGEVGLITGTGVITGSYGEHKFSHHIRFTDIYLHHAGHWKCYRSHATEIVDK